MSAPAIAVDQLRWQVAGKTILDGVSFTVPQGSFVSIVGPNGAGKTTLLKCLNRIHTGWQGTIRILGKALDEYPQAALAREVGYVPQGGTGGVAFTVHEFVMLGRYPHLSAFTSPKAADKAAVHEALALADAEALAERSCGTLSGGEMQRVLVAAALAQEARILLLDEPTTFLDPHHQSDVLRLLARLNREAGLTLLVVTHDINAAALTSDQILALRAGKVSFRGTPQELMNETVLSELFGGTFHFVEHPTTGQRVIVPEGVR